MVIYHQQEIMGSIIQREEGAQARFKRSRWWLIGKWTTQIRAMERFGYFFHRADRNGIPFPTCQDGKELCLKFHYKGGFYWTCPISHTILRGQIHEHYLWYIQQCQAAMRKGVKSER